MLFRTRKGNEKIVITVMFTRVALGVGTAHIRKMFVVP